MAAYRVLGLTIQNPQAGQRDEKACVQREVDDGSVHHRTAPRASFIGNTIVAGSGPGSATGVAPPGGILSFPADQGWELLGSIRIMTVFIDSMTFNKTSYHRYNGPLFQIYKGSYTN